LYSGIARRIAASGYGVFAMDYPGFGLSEGLHGYIPKFDYLVDDVIEHYTKIKGVSFTFQYPWCHIDQCRYDFHAKRNVVIDYVLYFNWQPGLI